MSNKQQQRTRTGVDEARAWLRMCRKRHRMRRQAFCSFSPLLIGTFPIEARVCFGCLSFQLRDGTVRKQLKCTRNRTNKQTNMQFPPSPSSPLLLMGSNYNKVDKRRAVRAARREEVGDRGGLQKWASFVLKFCFCFCFWALLISFFRLLQGVTAVCPKCT